MNHLKENKMKIKNLYQKLKPEVKGRLHSQDEKYDETVDRIVVTGQI
jgi:hypothetical protein